MIYLHEQKQIWVSKKWILTLSSCDILSFLVTILRDSVEFNFVMTFMLIFKANDAGRSPYTEYTEVCGGQQATELFHVFVKKGFSSLLLLVILERGWRLGTPSKN